MKKFFVLLLTLCLLLPALACADVMHDAIVQVIQAALEPTDTYAFFCEYDEANNCFVIYYDYDGAGEASQSAAPAEWNQMIEAIKMMGSQFSSITDTGVLSGAHFNVILVDSHKSGPASSLEELNKIGFEKLLVVEDGEVIFDVTSDGEDDSVPASDVSGQAFALGHTLSANDIYDSISINTDALNLGYFSDPDEYAYISAPVSFNLDGYVISRVIVGNIYAQSNPNVFCYTDANGQLLAVCVSSVCFSTDSMQLLYNQTRDCVIDCFETNTTVPFKIYTKNLTAPKYSDDGILTIAYLQDVIASPDNLPVKTCEDYYARLPNDILSSSENALLIEDYAKQLAFSKIIDMCNKYIDENEALSKYDNVHTILSLAEEGLALSQKCKISYDKFDQSFSATYKGINDVTKKISIASFAEGSNHYSNIGFRNSKWIFFDTVEIAADDMDTIKLFFGTKTIRDSSGSGVKEYAGYNFKPEEIEKLQSGKNPSIRFSDSSSDKSLERKLSAKEIDAIYTTYRLSRIYVELSNLVYPFKK